MVVEQQFDSNAPRGYPAEVPSIEFGRKKITIERRIRCSEYDPSKRWDTGLQYPCLRGYRQCHSTMHFTCKTTQEHDKNTPPVYQQPGEGRGALLNYCPCSLNASTSACNESRSANTSFDVVMAKGATSSPAPTCPSATLANSA